MEQKKKASEEGSSSLLACSSSSFSLLLLLLLLFFFCWVGLFCGNFLYHLSVEEILLPSLPPSLIIMMRATLVKGFSGERQERTRGPYKLENRFLGFFFLAKPKCCNKSNDVLQQGFLGHLQVRSSRDAHTHTHTSVTTLLSERKFSLLRSRMFVPQKSILQIADGLPIE